MLSFSLAVVYTVRGDGFATLSFSSISHLQSKEGHCISQGECNFGKSLIKLPTAGSICLPPLWCSHPTTPFV